MTPQLQQAIKLLALSNLEIEAFIGDALDQNPLLEAGQMAQELSGAALSDTSLPRGEEQAREGFDMPEDTGRSSSADGDYERGPDGAGFTGAGSDAADFTGTDFSGDGSFDAADFDSAYSSEPTADTLIAKGAGEADAPLDIDISALDRDRDTGDATSGDWDSGDWSASSNAGGEDAPGIDERSSNAVTLAEHLEGQIGAAPPTAEAAFIARYIIGLLDEAGYLATPLATIADALGTDEAAVEHALALVQTLDPTGVGARSLAECLALQAQEADRYDPCMARLLDNLDLIAKGSFAQLKRLCAVDDEDFADMLAELRSYDPKPGLRIGGSAIAPVTPDVLVTKAGDGGWTVAINQETLPKLIVNRSYYTQVRSGCNDRESRSWLSRKLVDANWLIKALDQRQKTILKVTSEIVKQQSGFFHEGVQALKPLTLRTVATAISMHESTVSRVTSNKYLHCSRGTFELKYFFSSGVGSSEGTEGVSAEVVKAQIRILVDAESPNKILSDDQLVEILRNKGYDLARRTVAKYREAIGIGSSVQRRRQKRLEGVN